MGKKKPILPPTDYDIINNILDRDTFTNNKGVTAYQGLDNYYLTKDYAEKAYNIDKYATDDLKSTDTYYDESGKSQSSNKLDNASWYSKLFGEDTEGKLLRISDDIIYPDGTTATERETRKALEQGLDPEFAAIVGASNAKSLAKDANARNGAIFDVLGVLGLGGMARGLSAAMVDEQKLIPYFHPTLKKWVSKVATQDDFDAGAAAMSAYGPKSDKDNFLTAFNKGFSNGMAGLPKSVARFNEWVGDLGEASINYFQGEGFKSEHGYADKLADRLNAGYKRVENQLAPNAQDNITSLEGLASGIGQGISSLLQYAATGGTATGFGAFTGASAAKLIGQGGVNALSKAGMLTAGFVLNGGEAYDSAKQAGLSEEDAALMALATGAINTAIEMKVGANKLQEYLVGAKGAKEIPRIILEETGGDLSKLNRTSSSIISRVTKSFDDLTKIPVLGTALEEGSEEFMQSLVSTTGQFLYNSFVADDKALENKGAYEAKSLGDVFKQAFEEATIGALVGGLAGFGVKNDIAEKETIMPFIASGKSDLILSSIQELVDKEAITPETAGSYIRRVEQLDKVWKTNGSVFDAVAANSNVDPEVVKGHALSLIDKEFELKQKTRDFRQKIADIKADPELSDSVKEEKIKELNTLLSSTTEEVSKITREIADLIPDENGNIPAQQKEQSSKDIKSYIVNKLGSLANSTQEVAEALFNKIDKGLGSAVDMLVGRASKEGLTPEIKKEIDNVVGLDNKEKLAEEVAATKAEVAKAKKEKKTFKKQVEEIIKQEEELEREANIEATKQKAELIADEEIDEINLEEATLEGSSVEEVEETVTLPETEIPLPTLEDELQLEEAVYEPLDTEEVSVLDLEKGKEVKANREIAVIDDGLARNPTPESRKALGDLRVVNTDLKRVTSNNIAYLGVDKVKLGRSVDGTIETRTFDIFDDLGNIKINNFVDIRLFSQNMFNEGDTVNLIVPTFSQMEERGLQDYSQTDYATKIEDVEEFPIAITDTENKIIGYFPTQSGIKRLVADEFKDIALRENIAVRQIIFENKNNTFSTTITDKSPGWLILDKLSNQKSLYEALGDGTKLADKVTLAVGKLDQLYVNGSRNGIFKEAVVNGDNIENGVVYSIVPSSAKDKYLVYPMDTNPIGKANAEVITEAIRLFAKETGYNEKEKQSLDNLSQEYNFKNFDDILSFINKIAYGSTSDTARDEYTFKLFRNNLFLSKSDSTKIFSIESILSSSETRSAISNILSTRFHSVKLEGLNSNEEYTSYKLVDEIIIPKDYNNYRDYLNENNVVTSNIRGIKIQNNEYAFTAQSVIALSNTIVEVEEDVREELEANVVEESIQDPTNWINTTPFKMYDKDMGVMGENQDSEDENVFLLNNDTKEVTLNQSGYLYGYSDPYYYWGNLFTIDFDLSDKPSFKNLDITPAKLSSNNKLISKGSIKINQKDEPKKTKKTLGVNINKLKNRKPDLDINPEFIQESNIQSAEDLMNKCL